MPAPLRVLMTADAVGGVWTHVRTLVDALGPAVDATVAVLGPQTPPPLPAAWRRRVHHHAGRLEWMPEPWTDVAGAGQWLLQVAARVRPDVIHVNGYVHAALPFEAPVLVGAHSCVCSWWRAVHGAPAPGEWDTYRVHVRNGLRAASRVVAPTRAMLQMLQAEHGVLPRTAVIRNGATRRRHRGVKESRIVSIGRFWDEAKNLDVLERVAPDLDWPVTLIGPLDLHIHQAEPGGGSGHAASAAQSGESRRPTGVDAVGALPPAQVEAWLRRAGIYAHPARYEPFGLSVLEAAQAGCALVLSDLASLREVWGPAALYVPPDDEAGWRTTLQALTACPDRVASLGAAARRVARRYTAAGMAQGYLRAYRQLAGRARSTTRRPALSWGLQPGATW